LVGGDVQSAATNALWPCTLPQAEKGLLSPSAAELSLPPVYPICTLAGRFQWTVVDQIEEIIKVT
jgi:hypothetical protein